MAGKVSTLILTVDLGCHLCSKKIRKTLSNFQDREHIESIFYDDKKNTVTISGPFDPQKLKKKLLCKACKVIKEIKVKEEEKKPPPPPQQPTKDTKPPESDKPKSAPPPKQKETEKPKEKDAGKEKPKEKEKHVTLPEPDKEKPKEKEKEKEKPKEKETEKVKNVEPAELKEKPKPTKETEPVVEDQPMWPSGPVSSGIPVCCWRPWHEWFSGGCRCSSCGKFFGWTAAAPPPAGVCPGSGYTYQFFCEEDPSCRIM